MRQAITDFRVRRLANVPMLTIPVPPDAGSYVVYVDGRQVASFTVRRSDHEHACRTAFMNVRRDVWSEREQRLRAQWESYG